MDIPWDDLRLFLAVAEARSMSAAARALHVGQPTLSRRIAALEETVDQRLFVRATTGVSLTPAAERLLPMARRMAEWAAEAARGLAGGERRPEGVVRVAAPPGVAFDFLAPVAALLRRKHPGLRLEVLAGIEFVNLVRGDADLALRTRAPQDRDLVVVTEARTRIRAYAAQAYARRLPRGYGLADLDWIAWAPPYQDLPPNPQLAAAIPGFRPIFTSNDFLVQLAALQAGVGAMILAEPYHRRSRAGDLVPLALELGVEGHARPAFYLVAARRALDVPRIRAVADLIRAETAAAAAPRAS
jgi:DNA-binding transcriptional LysR family regulator